VVNGRIIGDSREIGRFVVSGAIGSAVFYVLYLLIQTLEITSDRWKEAFSWGVAYLITSIFTHHLHRTISFPWRAPYGRSLRRTYVIYGTSLVVTTAIHDQFVHSVGIPEHLSFLMTLLIGGCGNYIAFRNWGFDTSP
jgi:putative flippase GtrA